MSRHVLFSAALIVGGLFTTGAFAQQTAIEALHNSPQTGKTAESGYTDHAAADRLGQAVDAYNTRPTPGAVDTADIGPATNRPASPAALQLARTITAYNGNAMERTGDSSNHDTLVDRDDQGAALALGREITAFNQTGGSLDVVGNTTSRLQ